MYRVPEATVTEEDAWDPFTPAKSKAQESLPEEGSTAHTRDAEDAGVPQPSAPQKSNQIAKPQTAGKHRNGFAFWLAVLLGLLGLFLLFFRPQERIVIPVTGTQQAMPHGTGGPYPPNHTDVTHSDPKGLNKEIPSYQPYTAITGTKDYSPYGFIALLLSLCCFVWARPGAGRASNSMEPFAASSPLFRWGAAALTLFFGLAAGLIFHFVLLEQAAFVYGAAMIGIYLGTLSSAEVPPSEVMDGKEGSAFVVGRVGDFGTRTESQQNSPSITIWTWSLERFDEKGNALALVPVEMRSHSISGFLVNGNEVEIPVVYRPGQLIYPEKVFNRTTQSWISVAKPQTGRGLLILLLFPFIALAVFGFFGGVLYLVINAVTHLAGQR